MPEHHAQTFYSITDLLNKVESSKDPVSKKFEPLHGNPNNSGASKNHGGVDRGRSLSNMLRDCRTLKNFTESIARIDALTEQAAGSVPPLPSVRRQRVSASQGYKINPHKVLRGDLAHAWTRMAKAQIPDGGRISRVMLCAQYPWQISGEQIEWTTAAGLALAAILEASGRSCELWTLRVSTGVYDDGTGTQTAVCLKAAGEPWSTHNVALTADPAWSRRLHFRLAEMLPGIVSHYGRPYLDAWRAAVSAFAASQGWDMASVLCGPTYEENITSAESATYWLKNRAMPAHD